jgi:hypothetical protein
LHRRSFVVLLSTLALVLALPAGTIAADSAVTKESGKSDVYLVRLAEEPALNYMGTIAGYARTAPAAGRKLNSTNANVRKYVGFLQARHGAVLNRVGAANKKIYSYVYAVNAFSAVLTGRQVATLRKTRGVVSVERDVLHKEATENSPTFLGLNASGGLWGQTGGQAAAGEDVIIGVIDTGIWPEHPSFSDQRDLRDRPGSSGKALRVYDAPPATWHGTCQSGELWSQDDCNNKLIGARYFLSGFGHHGIIKNDYKSARDADGHGTHTTSTAGGNAGVRASIFGIPRGTISGMAPRARVAMYKALWNDLGGFTSDLAAAIDAAVADGVDVINYSIGSSTPSLTSLDDIAFLNATTRGGVFVAASAGNDGPGAGTIGSPASVPWLLTVGASTQNRTFEGSVTLGSGATFKGASVTAGTGSQLRIVDAKDAGGELCEIGKLDPSKVAGNIVLCLRGVTDRVAKSRAILLAGGRGMVLFNPNDTQDLVTDNHWVPSVHINNTNGLAVRAYITAQGANARAQIFQGASVPEQGSRMAAFSSRGPDLIATDFIKPDVTAPGVNILAGNTATPFSTPRGQLFQSISGTSMSSPHAAGIAALLVQLHRTWTPAQIKSAMMTTGRQNVVKEDGTTAADPFDIGAGHIVPNSSSNPGLTFDATRNDYLKYLCTAAPEVFANPTATCASLGGAIDPSDLNLPSIGIGELAGAQTITRTATSVLSAGSTWTSSREGLAGINVSITPSITVGAAGSTTQRAAWQATFTTDTAALNQWAFGAIKWTQTGTGKVVRLPVALRPVALSAPGTITGTATGATLNLNWTVKAGYAGTLSANGYGLAPDTITAGETVAQDPDQNIETDTFTSGVKFYDFEITAASNTRYWAGGTREATTTPGSDLDVYLFRDGADAGETFEINELVAASADGDSEEIVQLTSPAVGKYRLLIHGWGTPGGGGSTYDLHRWRVDQAAADAGTLVATAGAGDPEPVTQGEVVPIQAAASGLSAAGQYRGIVHYVRDGTTVVGRTVVLINR